jgi:hypothetical protein
MTVTPCWYLANGTAPTVGSDGTVDTATCNGPTGNNAPGSYVWINVKYDFSPLAYLAIKQSLTFSTTSQVVINN